MPQTTPRYGYTAPTDDDGLDAAGIVAALDSIPSVIRATSAADATIKVDAAGRPALVLRTDTDTLWLHPATGDPQQIAGRGHGAQWNLGPTNSSNGAVTTLAFGSFTLASAGFTNSGSAVVIPAGGVYSFSVMPKMSGTPYEGRSFAQLLVNGTVVARFPGAGDNDWASSIDWPCAAGDLVTVQVHQQSGGARSFTAVVVAAQINAPAWT